MCMCFIYKGPISHFFKMAARILANIPEIDTVSDGFLYGFSFIISILNYGISNEHIKCQWHILSSTLDTALTILNDVLKTVYITCICIAR